MRKLAIVIAASALAVSAAGCAKQAPAESQQPAQQQAPAATPQQAPAQGSQFALVGTPAKLDPMSTAKIASDISSGFPMEVPVIEGTVTRGEAQGDDAWDYELAVASDAKSVAAWYQAAMSNRSWQVSDLVDRSADGGKGYEITLVKNGAQTRVVVVPEGEGSRVTVVLGVGAPVLQTQ